MTPEERGQSKHLVYQYLPSRYGMNPDDLRKADAIEVVLGQGAKPGGGGMLLGQKISDRVAGMRTLPPGIDQRSACRHPDWTGPDDLAIKILELREITDWEKPVYVKVGATRTYYDVKLAVAAGADVVVVDGMQGGTAATQDVFIEHVGIPTLAAIPQAAQALQELGLHRKVQLIVSGGIRTGADVAKAMALGADAVAIGTAALIALGDNHPRHAAEYERLGSAAGFYDDFQDGRDPAGITTQDPELAARLDPVEGGRRVANYLRVLTLEAQTLARACGKAHLRHLEPEDLVALTVEAAAMARVPLAGTSLDPGERSVTRHPGRRRRRRRRPHGLGDRVGADPARRLRGAARAVRARPPTRQLARHGTDRPPRLRRPVLRPRSPAGRSTHGRRPRTTPERTCCVRPAGSTPASPGIRPAWRALLAAEGVACDLLAPEEADARWPGMRFDGPVLFHPEAGVVDADAAVAAWLRRVGERDGQVLARTRVLSAEPTADGVLVHTDGPTVAANAVVVAAGPWLPELAHVLGAAVDLPPLAVTQQQVFHFRHRDPAAAWPTIVHKAELQIFGMPSGADGGPVPAFKLGQHDGGTPTTAATRDGVVDQACRERIVRHVVDRLPGLDPEPVAEASCLYTTTPDDDFVLDRIGPRGDRLTVLGPRGQVRAAHGRDDRRPRHGQGRGASALRAAETCPGGLTDGPTTALRPASRVHRASPSPRGGAPAARPGTCTRRRVRHHG